MPKRKKRERRIFTDEQKRTMVREALDSGRPVQQMARKFSISSTSLRRWIDRIASEANPDTAQAREAKKDAARNGELERLGLRPDAEPNGFAVRPSRVSDPIPETEGLRAMLERVTRERDALLETAILFARKHD